MYRRYYMKNFKVLKEFSTGPDEAKVNYEVDAIIELDPEVVTNIDELIKDGIIEIVADEEEKKDDEAVDTGTVEKQEDIAPKKFYRGDLIIDEQPRTVGAQTFQHIKTSQGHEFDLTEEEYKKDVTVSK